MHSFCATESMDCDDEEEESASSAPSKPIAPTEVTSYQSITNEQEPTGEWSSKLNSAKHAEIFEKLVSKLAGDSEICKFTAYALLMLLVGYSEAFDEWKLSAVKAVTYLRKNAQPCFDAVLIEMLVDAVQDAGMTV